MFSWPSTRIRPKQWLLVDPRKWIREQFEWRFHFRGSGLHQIRRHPLGQEGVVNPRAEMNEVRVLVHNAAHETQWNIQGGIGVGHNFSKG